MWVFARAGFYSVVKKPVCAADELEVRTRCRKDLEVLKKKTGSTSKILTNAGTDYPFRLRIKREEWARFLADEAMSIDYPNFKDEVLFGKTGSARERKHRHDVYHEVWKALLPLSGASRERRRHNRRQLQANVQGDQHLIDYADPDSSPDLPKTVASGKKPLSLSQRSKFWGK